MESIAFNGLPGSLTSNLRQHVYYCIPNNVVARYGLRGFNQDYVDATVPSPSSGFPCCCYNFHMGWPKLVKHSWMKTADEGLAMCIALPVKVNTTVRGQHMQLSTETNYPFGEKVVVRVEAAPDSATSISLRLPTWCSSPTITVNSVPVEGIQPATFARIERIWKAGDMIELHLPMQISLKEGISRSVSVHRGPLVFALSISQRRAVHKREGPKNFDSIEFYPGADWNYGLLIDRENPSSSFEVVERPMPMNPFDRDSTPSYSKLKPGRLMNGHWSRKGVTRMIRHSAPYTAMHRKSQLH